MKLEDQICTLSQGEKLKFLGVIQQSIFWTPVIPDASKILAKINPECIGMDNDHAQILSMEKQSVNDNCVSRFTSAELGAMLPESFYSGKTWYFYRAYYNGLTYRSNNDDDKVRVMFRYNHDSKTEAQARAEMVIQLISKKLVKVDVINSNLLA